MDKAERWQSVLRAQGILVGDKIVVPQGICMRFEFGPEEPSVEAETIIAVTADCLVSEYMSGPVTHRHIFLWDDLLQVYTHNDKQESEAKP